MTRFLNQLDQPEIVKGIKSRYYITLLINSSELSVDFVFCEIDHW